MTLCEGIIGMYEAAFGAFNVVESKGIRDATKFKAIGVVERSRIEHNNSVPTALYRYGMAWYHSTAGGLGSEVWECRCYGFVAIAVPQRKGIVVLGWLGEVQRAGSGIVAVSGCEQCSHIFSLKIAVSNI